MTKAEQELRCPQCGSAKSWRDGIRYTGLGQVQRYICRNCGYRFSDPKSHQPIRIQIEGPRSVARTQTQRKFNVLSASEHVERIPTKALKSILDIPSNCQICVIQTKETKNLAAAESQKQAAGISPQLDQATVKGLIIKFLAWLESEGYPKDTSYTKFLKVLVSHGANLLDPEQVKAVIGKLAVKNGTKALYTYAYDAFCKMEKLSWNRPQYKQEEALPFVPDEKELDMLIAGCRSRRMATFLQCLKETYADPGEILRLRWIDISGNIITINCPVKGHLPGQIQVSNRLIAMLNSLPRTSERIFPIRYDVITKCFRNTRKRLADYHKNPRLLAIHFTTFRHWGGTMIAHYAKGNVLTVKKMLRHKRIENTMKYIHMITFKDDEFETATATTVEEATQLAAAGFEKFDEFQNIHIYRRPKRFANL